MKSGILWMSVLLLCAGAVHARQSAELQPALIPPGGLPIFFDSEGPLSYRSMTPRDVPQDATPMGRVSGRSCQFSLAIPLALSYRATSVSGAIGNGTYTKILTGMKKEHPELRGIYDVKVDLQRFAILGIFGKLCTEVDAAGFR